MPQPEPMHEAAFLQPIVLFMFQPFFLSSPFSGSFQRES